MSVKPRIFISSVSRELASTRQIVANTLLFLNYEPVWQDIIGVEQGEIRDILRRQIDSCVGLIQLTGQRYGLEPSEPDPEFGRVSYTQYEALYAVRRGMKVWHFLLDENFTPDQPNDEPEELRKLQQDYRKKIEQSDRLWHAMPNASELEKHCSNSATISKNSASQRNVSEGMEFVGVSRSLPPSYCSLVACGG